MPYMRMSSSLVSLLWLPSVFLHPSSHLFALHAGGSGPWPLPRLTVGLAGPPALPAQGSTLLSEMG